MTEQQINQQKKYFHQDMVKYFKQTAKEVKYKPTRRLDLINKYGGYEAAIKMLPTDSNTFDFTLLWEAQRLDLSIEALVTKESYRVIFPQHIVDFCQRRLDEYNYAPKKIIEVEEEPPITPYIPEEEEMAKDVIDTALETPQKEHTEEVMMHENGIIEKGQTTVNQQPVKNKQMDDFIDSFFDDWMEEKTDNQQNKEDEEDLDDIEKAIKEHQWMELLRDSKIFTQPNKDLMQKIAAADTIVTPQKLSEFEGYNESYPLYTVVNTLAKRVKRKLDINLEQLNLSEKECWQLLFAGEMIGDKNYRWTLRKPLKNTLQKEILE